MVVGDWYAAIVVVVVVVVEHSRHPVVDGFGAAGDRSRAWSEGRGWEREQQFPKGGSSS